MSHFPALQPGVRVTGAAVTVTLSDGTSRTVDIPAEYHPDDMTVNLSQLPVPAWRRTAVDARPARYEVTLVITAGFWASAPPNPPRSFYRIA